MRPFQKQKSALWSFVPSINWNFFFHFLYTYLQKVLPRVFFSFFFVVGKKKELVWRVCLDYNILKQDQLKCSLLHSRSGRSHATRPVGERCVTPAGAAAKETNWNPNHVQNWFGLVFLAETCFSSFDRTSSLVLSFSIVLFLYKRDPIRLVGRNRITRHQTIIYSKTFSGKDYKPEVPSYSPCALTLWDVKEPTHSSQRVGHGVPGVVVWSFQYVVGSAGLAWRASVWMRPQLRVTARSQAT